MTRVHQRHRQADRLVDGRTTYHSITALCGASRGKNNKNMNKRNDSDHLLC